MTRRFADAARQAARCAAVLGWTPDTFWSATPADLHLALGVEAQARDCAPLGTAALRTLMEAFPDG